MPDQKTGTPQIALIAPAPSPWPGMTDIALLTVFISAGVVLRFLHLADKPFWFDEGVSVAIARLDWYNFARILGRHEANMTLYYLALRPWLAIAHSEAFVRALSALFGVVSIPAIYFLGREVYGRRAGLTAAILLTFNAFHVRYSQEARTYTLFVLLSMLSSFYFVRSSKDPSPQNLRWHLVTSVLAVYAHFFAALLLVAQWLWARLHPSSGQQLRQNWRSIAAFSAPLLLFVVSTGAGPLAWIPRPRWRDLFDFSEMLAGHGGWLLLLLSTALAAAGVLYSLRRGPASHTSFLLLWLAGPVVFIFVLSQVRSFFLPRYLIFVLPAFLLLVANGLQTLPKAWLRGIVLAALLLLSWAGVSAYYRQDFDIAREDWRNSSHYVLAHAQPGDVLVFHVLMGRMPYEFYRWDSPGPLVIAPRHGERITYQDFLGRPSRSLLESLAAQYPRVWVVLSHNERALGQGPDDTTAIISDVLAANYFLSDDRKFPGVEVRLYSRLAAKEKAPPP